MHHRSYGSGIGDLEKGHKMADSDRGIWFLRNRFERSRRMKRRIYSVLAENRSGVLCKVAGLFSRRCFNIDSLAVGETDDPAVS